MVFTVYIIESKAGKLYTGHTSDLNKRIIEHNSGGCKTTKTDTGWHTIYKERYHSRSEAMRREKWLKSGKGREFIKTVLNK